MNAVNTYITRSPAACDPHWPTPQHTQNCLESLILCASPLARYICIYSAYYSVRCLLIIITLTTFFQRLRQTSRCAYFKTETVRPTATCTSFSPACVALSDEQFDGYKLLQPSSSFQLTPSFSRLLITLPNVRGIRNSVLPIFGIFVMLCIVIQQFSTCLRDFSVLLSNDNTWIFKYYLPIAGVIRFSTRYSFVLYSITHWAGFSLWELCAVAFSELEKVRRRSLSAVISDHDTLCSSQARP